MQIDWLKIYSAPAHAKINPVLILILFLKFSLFDFFSTMFHMLSSTTYTFC